MDFDEFVDSLMEESKALFEKAKGSDDLFTKNTYLHASLLLSLSYLESCVNSIISEILVEPYNNKYGIMERSILLEKEIKFEKGQFYLSNKLKMSRLTDRIELLYYIIQKQEISQSDTWFITLKQSIDIRNKLVHPKEPIIVTEKQVENALNSVLDTVNNLYQAVYKKKLPSYNRGLSSKYELKK